MSPLGEFLILVIGFTGLTLFYSIKQFEESKPQNYSIQIPNKWKT